MPRPLGEAPSSATPSEGLPVLTKLCVDPLQQGHCIYPLWCEPLHIGCDESLCLIVLQGFGIASPMCETIRRGSGTLEELLGAGSSVPLVVARATVVNLIIVSAIFESEDLAFAQFNAILPFLEHLRGCAAEGVAPLLRAGA